jgi:hypothetical protein
MGAFIALYITLAVNILIEFESMTLGDMERCHYLQLPSSYEDSRKRTSFEFTPCGLSLHD